jgi:predicted nucleic acid-binding protein
VSIVSGLTLDTGALIAIERRDRRTTSLVESARMRGGRITVSAAVIVEWWRGQRGPFARVLDAFDVEPLDADLAKLAGQALALSPAGPSPVDAVVMASAAMRGDVVLTSDVEDLEALRVAFPEVRVLSVSASRSR